MVIMNKLYATDIVESSTQEKYERTYKNTIPSSRMLVFMTGFCIGMVYFYFQRNVLLEDVRFFDTALLLQLENYEVKKIELFFYVFKVRFQQLVLLLLCCGNVFAKGLWYCVLVWLGFQVSIVFFSCSYQYGIKGLFLCLMSFFPQGIFYFIDIFKMIHKIWDDDAKYYHKYYPVKDFGSHKKVQTIIFIALILFFWIIGVLCESYINPILIKQVASLF